MHGAKRSAAVHTACMHARKRVQAWMVASPGSASSGGKGWPFRIGTFTTSQSSQRQNWKNVVRTPRAAVIANTSRACAPHMARSLMAVGPQMECRERGGQRGTERG